MCEIIDVFSMVNYGALQRYICDTRFSQLAKLPNGGNGEPYAHCFDNPPSSSGKSTNNQLRDLFQTALSCRHVTVIYLRNTQTRRHADTQTRRHTDTQTRG